MTEYKRNTQFTRPDNSKPPLIQDVLAAVIEKSRMKIPDCMPSQPFDAAHWWIAHQEKPHPSRDIPEVLKKDGQVIGWSTPYHDRLVHTLRKFLSLIEPHQVFLVQNIKAGIPWRGDSIESYAVIVEQHREMKKDPDTYRANAKRILDIARSIAKQEKAA